MLFSEAYGFLLEALSVRTTPQFWTVAELKRYLNLGQKEFARQTEFCSRIAPMTMASPGRYYLPTDVLKQKGIYLAGKLLEQRPVEFLEGTAGGTSHHLGLRGDGLAASGDWRIATGQTEAWYLEDMKACLYPIPSTTPVIPGAFRTKQAGVLAAGTLTINLASAITTSLDLVDLYLNGVYQHKGQFSIPNSATIILAGPALEIALDYEVVAYPAVVSNATTSFNYSFWGAAGQALIHIPIPYYLGVNAITLYLNGIAQAPATFTEVDNFTITLDAPLPVAMAIGIKVILPISAEDCRIRYVFAPPAMVDNSESPMIPDQFQDSIWYWAAFRALSREGRGQDLEKASLYSTLFRAEVDNWRETFQAPPMPYPDVPFMV